MANVSIQPQNHFTGLWNRVRFLKAQKSVLWCDLEIPAKLFYKISDSNDKSLLVIKGKSSIKELEKSWFKIIDMVFTVRRDARSQNIQLKQVQIALLNHKIKAIEAIINVLYGLLLTENQQNELIAILKRMQIHLKSASQDEIGRVLQRDLNGLKAKLKIEIDRLKDMSKPLDKKVIYEEICLSISMAINLNLGINMTLGEFLAAEKTAIKISNKQRKKNG